MEESKYAFVSEVKEKKRTARGAYNRKTHAGKGGRVKFPSDYMTQKELKAMSGEVHSYRMNDPMNYEEFKALPDDIKKIYITALRNKFGVTDAAIAEMLDISTRLMGYWIRKLDISGKKVGIPKSFDSDGWHKWLNGIRDQMQEENICIVEEPIEKEPIEKEPEEIALPAKAAPESGMLRFKCDTKAALEAIGNLLPSDGICIEVTWYKSFEGEVFEF